MRKMISILGLAVSLCLAGCGHDDSSRSSQQLQGGQPVSVAGASHAVQNPFPGASEVRLFVEKGDGPDGTPIFSKPGGRLLTADALADFEGALRIEQAPEAMAACFIPHHFSAITMSAASK